MGGTYTWLEGFDDGSTYALLALLQSGHSSRHHVKEVSSFIMFFWERKKAFWLLVFLLLLLFGRLSGCGVVLVRGALGVLCMEVGGWVGGWVSFVGGWKDRLGGGG